MIILAVKNTCQKAQYFISSLKIFPDRKIIRRKCQRGFLIPYMMFIIFLFGVLGSFFAGYIQMKMKALYGTKGGLDARIVLDSIMNYTINGVKAQICFSDTMEADNINCDPAKTDEWFAYDGYTKRLLLSDREVAAMVLEGIKMPVGFNGQPDPTMVRLQSISRTILLSELNVGHPLYEIMTPIASRYLGIVVELSRLQGVIEPTRGDETMLRINVTLIPLPSAMIGLKSVTSKVTFYPRKLNTFSLIVPGSLYLGSASGTPDLTLGDTTIPLKAGLTNANQGIHFESPVYVGGNIFLPPSTNTDTGIVFSDKVIMGEVPNTSTTVPGTVYQDGFAFQPKTFGGPGDLYAGDTPGFKGFLKGIEMDGQYDAGLSRLFGLTTGGMGVGANGALCQIRMQAATDNTVTRDSQIFTTSKTALSYVGTAAQSTFDLTLNYGLYDVFVAQPLADSAGNVNPNLNFAVSSDIPNMNGILPGLFPYYAGNPLLHMKMTFIGLTPYGASAPSIYKVEAYLPRTGTFNIYPMGLTSTGAVTSGTAPVVTVSTTKHIFKSQSQASQVDVRLDFQNFGPAANTVLVPFSNGLTTYSPEVQVEFEGFDFAYVNGHNKRADLDVTTGSLSPTIAYTTAGTNNVYRIASVGFVPDVGGGFIIERGMWDTATSSFNTATANMPGSLVTVGTTISGYPWAANAYLDASNLNPAIYDTSEMPEAVETIDLTGLDLACFKVPPDSATLYHGQPPVGYGYSFLGSTRNTWQYQTYCSNCGSDHPIMPTTYVSVPPLSNPGQYGYYNAAMDISALYDEGASSNLTTWRSESVVKECVISASNNVVTGFFVCEKLTIAARTKPLQIVGTIIAKVLSIDPSAIASGIRWTSLFHPASIRILRRVGELTEDEVTKTPCADEPRISPKDGEKVTSWDSHESAHDHDINKKCSPEHLSDTEHFSWTSVDPDCGLFHDPNGNFPDGMKCKYQATRYSAREISRSENYGN